MHGLQVGTDHLVIGVGSGAGSQGDAWFVVYRDGRIKYHFENDGYYALRHGLNAQDRPATRAALESEIKNSYLGRERDELLRKLGAFLGEETD